MKNFAKIVLLSVALLSSVIANASKGLNVKVSSSNELNISFSSILEGEKLSITDRLGKVVYKEVLSKSDFFNKSFKFDQFSQGVHYVKTVTKGGTRITPFIIVPSQFKVIRGKSVFYHHAKLDVKNSVISITLKNKLKLPITITVLSDNGKELNIVKDNRDELILKRYDASSLLGDNCTMLIKQGDKTFIREVKL